jgi:o-succinylbenzoate synthase
MTAITVRAAEIVRVSGALVTPAGNAHHTWPSRAGLLLRLTDERGCLGQGEASPLPGVSPDQLDDCARVLAALGARAWPRLRVDEPASAEITKVWAALDVGPALPAARFAIETALCDLLGQRTHRPLSALLSDTTGTRRAEAPVAALLVGDDPEHVLAAARAAQARGIGTFKLKLGRARFADERTLVFALRRALGESCAIRVDVNGAWTLAEAPARLAALAAAGIELGEQLVAAGALADLGAARIPIAADESLADPAVDIDRLLGSGVCRAAVLKPMVLGGLHRCLELFARARGHGVEVVVSHLFDGPVALAAAGALALSLPSPYASGLAPHAGLGAWPAARPASLPDRIRASDRPGLGLDPLVVPA